MNLLEKEPVKRAEKSIKEYNNEMSVIVLDSSAKTAIEAASSLGCEVGAIVKSLLFKTESTFTLFLVSGDFFGLVKGFIAFPLDFNRFLDNHFELS